MKSSELLNWIKNWIIEFLALLVTSVFLAGDLLGVLPEYNYSYIWILSLFLFVFLSIRKIIKLQIELTYQTPNVEVYSFFRNIEDPKKETLILKFHNNPKYITEESSAKQVVALVRFFSENRKLFLGPIIGRWSERKTPTKNCPFSYLDDLNTININSNGYPVSLDVAVKYIDDENAYVYTNYSLAHHGYKCKEYQIPRGNYIVDIRLKGIRLDKNFVFWFENYGKGKGLNFSKTSYVKKSIIKLF